MAFRNFALLLRLGICALLLTGAPLCDATAAARDDQRVKKILSDAAQLDQTATRDEAAVVDGMAQRYALLAGSSDAAKQLIVGLRDGTILQQTDGQPVRKRLSYGTVYRVLVAATDELRTQNISPPATRAQLAHALNSALASVLDPDKKAKSEAASSTNTSKSSKKESAGSNADQDKGSGEPSKDGVATPNPKDDGAKGPENGNGNNGGNGKTEKTGSDPVKNGDGSKKGPGIAGDSKMSLGDCGGLPCGGGGTGTAVDPRGIPDPVAVTTQTKPLTNTSGGGTTTTGGGTTTTGVGTTPTGGGTKVGPADSTSAQVRNTDTRVGNANTWAIPKGERGVGAITRTAPPVTGGTVFNPGTLRVDPKGNSWKAMPGIGFQKGVKQ